MATEYSTFRICYADPPWKYGSKQPFRTEGERFHPLEYEYQTQKTDWLRQIPLSAIMEDDAAIFMWATDSHIPDAISLMEAWGFKYVTVAFVWEKLSPTGKTFVNVAPWTLKSYELCLLGTRGRMSKHKKKNNVLQKVAAQRFKHSQKPEEVRTRIEELFPGPYIELFARNSVSGWTCLGNEIDGVDIVDAVVKIITKGL